MPEDSKDKEPGEESNSSSERHERIDVVEAAALAGLPFPSFEEKIPKEELEELKAYYELVQEEALSREEASQPSDVLAELNKLFQKPSYKLLKEIGHGAFGSVYEGRNALDGSVAIKILSSGFKRCITEGQAAVRVKSDYAVMIHAHGELADGRMYLVMDLVESEFDDPSLQAYIKPDLKRPPEEKILRWMKQISNGMQNAHKANVIHRDLKPKNILIDISRNKEGRARICDFGLARIEADSDSPPEDLGSDSEVLDVSNAISDSPELSSAESESIYKSQAYFAGTAHYSAPEQVKDTREANELSDIYSFGATFYHLASGEFPMGNMTSLEVEELKKEPVENIPAPKELNKLNQNLSEGICFLIMDCLENKSFDRPGSFEDILADLKEIENQIAFDKDNLEREKELQGAEVPEPYRRKIHADRVKEHNARTYERKKKRAAILRRQGVEYQEEGELLRAITMYTRTLHFHPEDIVALVSRGRAHNSAGDYDKAILDLTKAISIDSEHAAAWNNRGVAYAEKGELIDAIENYDKAVALNPKYEDAWFNRGNYYIDNDHPDKAIENYSEAIRLKPGDADIWNNRGYSHSQNGNPDKAIADYTEAIRLESGNATVWNNRGYSHAENGDHDKALEDYTKAIDLKPRYTKAFNNRGNSHCEKGSLDKALEDYKKAIRLDPMYALAWNGRGNVHAKKSALGKAFRYYTKAVRIDPKFAYAWNGIGYCYGAKGDYDKAIENLDEAIRLNPKLALAWSNRGDCYREKGEHDKAIENLDEAIRLDRGLDLAWNNRGDCYREKGEHDKAIENYDEAIRLNIYIEAGTWNSRGISHQEAGNQAAAEADFRKAAELGYIEENEK